jgi:3-isopropylmalate dehydrogenase
MVALKLLVLEGDGIGPEVTAQALRVLRVIVKHSDLEFDVERGPFGGRSIDEHGVPVTEAVLKEAARSDAVLLGAVGGPKWDHVEQKRRAETGLLQIRRAMSVYANLRPARFFPQLSGSGPLKKERTEGVDFIVVRELVGGIYFGLPRGFEFDGGEDQAVNTMVYTQSEVRRLGHLAFELARSRNGRLTSVDKANVLEVSRLWRNEMIDLAKQYPDVELDHLYVDNCAMQLVTNPAQFDVVATGNLFGDILSDIAGALTGSLGMLPSASLGDGTAIYEPVHGSAPDIAGKGIANPLGAILSVAMMLEMTAKRGDLARAVENAVTAVLDDGLRTADLGSADGKPPVGTEEMGSAVLERLEQSLSRPKGSGRGAMELPPAQHAHAGVIPPEFAW